MVCIICFSCKSTVKGQQKNNDSIKKEPIENKKPVFSEKDIYHKINPNTIELVGEIVTVEDNSVLCGQHYETIFLIKVQRIIGSGSGIINMLNKGETFKAIFSKKLLFNNDKPLDSIFKKGSLFQVNVFEKLCFDTNKTTYFISNYKKR